MHTDLEDLLIFFRKLNLLINISKYHFKSLESGPLMENCIAACRGELGRPQVRSCGEQNMDI